jgi:hypothetical protein
MPRRCCRRSWPMNNPALGFLGMAVAFRGQNKAIMRSEGAREIRTQLAEHFVAGLCRR